MGFTAGDRRVLLAVKGVGPTVIDRLEQIGIDSLAMLADTAPGDILDQVSAMLGATCWRNSPQAQSAIVGAIEAAKRRCGP